MISAEFLRRIADGGGGRDAAALPRARRRRQQGGGRLRSGHRGRPRGGAGDPRADPRRISRPRHSRRGASARRTRPAEHVWVIDPIDGTRAFISGIPVWGTLVGLTARRRRGRRPDGAALHRRTVLRRRRRRLLRRPGRQPRALATRDDGSSPTRCCSRRRRRCSRATVRDALRPAGERRCGSRATAPTATPIAMVAAGHVDIVVEAGLQSYDIVALIPIIEEAGGVVTDLGRRAGRRRAATSSPPRRRSCMPRRWQMLHAGLQRRRRLGDERPRRCPERRRRRRPATARGRCRLPAGSRGARRRW